MASENTDTNVGNDEESAPVTDTNEHDYAHTADSNFTSTEATVSLGTPAGDDGVTEEESFAIPSDPDQCASVLPSVSLPVELPEPAVGAEVDCPGGNELEAPSLPLPTDADTPKNERSSGTGKHLRGPRRPIRPEDRNCACCKSEFEKQGRSFNRRAVYTFTTPETVQYIFPDSLVNDKSFLCETCAQVIRRKGKRKQTGKRIMWLKPPAEKQSEVRDKKKKVRKMGKKGKAALLVSKSCYKSAFKMLWSAKGARKPMMEFWSKQLKEEMKVLSRHPQSPFQQKVVHRKPLSNFPWRRCLIWAQEKAPLITTCLRSLFPDINALSKSGHNQLSEEHAQMLLERRTVVALSVPLFTRNIWKNNFLQAALGAELRLQGCASSALDVLNTMGLCQNKDTVRLLLHRLRDGKTIRTRKKQRLGVKTKQEEIKRDHEEEDVEEEDDDDEEEEEDEEKDEEEEEEEEEEDEEEELEMAVEEEVEEEEVQDGVQDDDDDDEDQTAEEEKNMRTKNAKKQRKDRGKRKAKDREEEEDEEEGSEQKKSRVVVVRLGLLKGHSEVGRSDLSAP